MAAFGDRHEMTGGSATAAGAEERAARPVAAAAMHRRCLEWAIAGGLSVAALLWPAFYNGFPIVYFDTGGYIAAPFVDALQPGRNVAYGILLAVAHWDLNWWPAVAVQAAVLVWMIHLVARVHRLPSGPWALLATIVVLALLTGLPWYAAQLMPDAFTAVVILVLYLLAFRAERLSRWERAALAAVGAFAIAVHMSHAVLACGLLPVIAVAAGMRRARVRLPALVVALGLLAIPLTNAIATGRPGLTPGGEAFIFGRLVQDGIVARFLAERCPSPEFRLCEYRESLPKTADEWIWDAGSPFLAIGGWQGGADEMRRITLESLALLPAEHVFGLASNTWTQFWTFATGDGLDEGNKYWFLEYALATYYPRALADFVGTRQHAAQLTSATFSGVHVLVAFASLAVTAAALAFAALRRDRQLADLCAFVLLALLGNAVICGVLSNPHDRYQSRIVWLATLCAILAVQTLLSRAVAKSRTGGPENPGFGGASCGPGRPPSR